MMDDLVYLSSIFFISGIQKQAILFLQMAILGFEHDHGTAPFILQRPETSKTEKGIHASHNDDAYLFAATMMQ